MDSMFALGIIFSAIDNLTGPVRGMQRTVAGLEETARHANGLAQFGQRATAAGGLVAGAAGRMSRSLWQLVDPVVAIDDAVVPLRSVVISTMGDVDLSIQQAVDAGRRWAETNNDTVETFLDAYGRLSAARLVDVDALEATHVAMMLASATMGDQGQAADTLATIYRHLGDTQAPVADEMMRIADTLTRARQIFRIQDFSELAAGIAPSTLAAREARMEMAELVTVLGQLNTEGFGGGQAGSAVAGILRNLIPASRTLGFEIRRANDGSLDLLATLDGIREAYGTDWHEDLLIEFQRAFGYEGAQAITLLLPQIESLTASLADVRDAAGATAVAHEDMGRRASEQLRLVGSNFRLLQGDVGEHLMPTLSAGIDRTLAFISTLRGVVAAHPDLVRTIVVVAAVAVAIMSIVGPTLVVIGTFAMLGGRGVQAVIGIYRAFVMLYTFFRGGAFLGHLQRLQAAFVLVFNLAHRGAIGAAGALSTLATWLRIGAMNAAGMVRQVIVFATSALPPAIAGAWSFAAALLANPITWIVAAIVALIVAIVLLVRHWDTVTAAVSAAWEGSVAAVRNGVEWVRNAINEMIQWLFGLPGRMREAGAELWNSFTEGVRSVLSRPVELVQEGLASLRNLLPWSDAREGPLSDLTQSGAALVDTWQAGAESRMPDLYEGMESALGNVALTLPPLELPEAPMADGLTITVAPVIEEAPVVPDVPDFPPLSPPMVAGVAEYQASLGETPALPDLAGVAAYQVEPIATPELEALMATAEFRALLGDLPEVPGLVGTAGYDVQPPVAPDLPGLTGAAEYRAAVGDLPELPELAGVADYQVQPLTSPELADLAASVEYQAILGQLPEIPGLEGVVGYDMPDLEPPEAPDLVATLRYEVQRPDLPELGRQVAVGAATTQAARTTERPRIEITIVEARDARATAAEVRRVLEEIFEEGADG